MFLTGLDLHAGADKEIDVIDVSRQCDLKMRLGEFVEYYNSPNRERVLNVISLEFSETRYASISFVCSMLVCKTNVNMQ